MSDSTAREALTVNGTFTNSTMLSSVVEKIEQSGFVPSQFIDDEVEWFYTRLGIDDVYFRSETVVRFVPETWVLGRCVVLI